MSVTQFVDFINKTQRDPRLNEILHPYVNDSRAKDLIEEYEPNKLNVQKGQLSFDGFLRYLLSDDNSIMTHSRLELSEDMDQPIAHYYINSSHNTYLTGTLVCILCTNVTRIYFPVFDFIFDKFLLSTVPSLGFFLRHTWISKPVTFFSP